MSKIVNDGGPAFPATEVYWSEATSKMRDVKHPGMTLRDFFAAKAMQTLLQGAAAPKDLISDLFALISESSYQMADAMIAARGGEANE